MTINSKSVIHFIKNKISASLNNHHLCPYNEWSLFLIGFYFQFKMMLSEDGSGKGAALVAAVSARVAAEKAAKH